MFVKSSRGTVGGGAVGRPDPRPLRGLRPGGAGDRRRARAGGRRAAREPARGHGDDREPLPGRLRRLRAVRRLAGQRLPGTGTGCVTGRVGYPRLGHGWTPYPSNWRGESSETAPLRDSRLHAAWDHLRCGSGLLRRVTAPADEPFGPAVWPVGTAGGLDVPGRGVGTPKYIATSASSLRLATCWEAIANPIGGQRPPVGYNVRVYD